jgi:hypothetical protein
MEARRACAFVWSILVVLALVGCAGRAPLAVVAAWVIALGATFFTSRATRNAIDERLDYPLAYRTAAAVALAVPLAGALLVAVPGHSDVTSLFAVYFLLIAVLAYRALVATGPRAALATLAAAQLLAVPFVLVGAVMSMGCKCGHHPPPPWTDRWTLIACAVAQLFAMIAAGIAPIAFHPRDPDMPEARLHHGAGL